MTKLEEQIKKTDMAAWMTPLYYFGISAQFKMVMDHFYSFNGKLAEKN